MKDLSQAEQLGIAVHDVVTVTHSELKTRGGKPRVFHMPYLAFEKRGLAERGFVVEGQSRKSVEPRTFREKELETELAALREKLASQGDGQDQSAAETDKAVLQQRLDALGVKYHHKAGAAKLQALLDEALAAMNDDDFGDEDPE